MPAQVWIVCGPGAEVKLHGLLEPVECLNPGPGQGSERARPSRTVRSGGRSCHVPTYSFWTHDSALLDESGALHTDCGLVWRASRPDETREKVLSKSWFP